MRPAVFLVILLLATGNTSSQSTGRSRDALEIYWRLARSNDFWSPSVFTICAGILGLLVMAFEGKNTLKRRSKSFTNSVPTGRFSHTVEIYGFPDITQTLHVTPLYVRRMMQFMAKRHVTQVSNSSPVTPSLLPVNNEKEISEIWRKRDEKIRKKNRERRSQGPRINPDVLREINNTWQLTYGFKCGDLIFIENELDNTVSKVPLVNSTKKSKLVKFDNSVKVVHIEKENSGRQLKCWKEARKIVKNIVSDRNSNGRTVV